MDYSFRDGPAGNSCPKSESKLELSFNGHPFSDTPVEYPVMNASSFALGQSKSGTFYVIAFNTQTNSADSAVGGGIGVFALPSGPDYIGLTRDGPGLTIVYSNAPHAVNYTTFNDAGTMIGSGSIDGGGADLSNAQLFNFRTSAGLFVVASDIAQGGVPNLVSASGETHRSNGGLETLRSATSQASPLSARQSRDQPDRRDPSWCIWAAGATPASGRVETAT